MAQPQPQTPPQTDYQQIMLAAIMKAFEVGELRLPYKTPQTARSMRARLYAFIKSQRAKPGTPLAFLDAAAELTFSVEGSTLVMIRKDRTESFSVMLDAVGAGAIAATPPVKAQEELASLEKLQRIMGAQGLSIAGSAAAAEGDSEDYKARVRAYKGE